MKKKYRWLIHHTGRLEDLDHVKVGDVQELDPATADRYLRAGYVAPAEDKTPRRPYHNYFTRAPV